jgi:hypothetical protein
MWLKIIEVKSFDVHQVGYPELRQHKHGGKHTEGENIQCCKLRSHWADIKLVENEFNLSHSYQVENGINILQPLL